MKIHGLAVFGACLLLIILSPYQLGFSPDSITYLEAARNVVDGEGVVNNEGSLVNHWPPLFSMSLSLVSLILDIDAVKSGVILMTILFYIFLTLNMSILRLLKVSDHTIFIFGLCLIFSPLSINFLNFLSEGLFFVLLSASFYFFLRWVREHKILHLGICALFCGLFFLTRYAGIAFVGCYCLYLLLLNRMKLKQRVMKTLLFISIFILSIASWFIYQSYFEKPEIGRSVGVHLIPVSKIQDLVITIANWFVGSEVGIILFIGILLLYLQKRKAVLDYILATYRLNKNLVHQVLLFIFFYLLMLIISISFFDSYTPLNNRILSPLLTFILIPIFLFLNLLYQRREKILFIITTLFIFLSFSTSVFPIATRHFNEGGGYSRKEWIESPTLSYIKDKPMKSNVFSNGIEIGKLHLQKDFDILPRKNELAEIDQLTDRIRNGQAMVVFFKEVNWRNYLVSGQTLKELVGDNYLLEFEDGFILGDFTD